MDSGLSHVPVHTWRALDLLLPAPHLVKIYVEKLAASLPALEEFEVVFTDKHRPADEDLPLHLVFAIHQGNVSPIVSKYENDKLLDLLPITDGILLSRFEQGENNIAYRDRQQSADGVEEQDERHNLRWLTYSRRMLYQWLED